MAGMMITLDQIREAVLLSEFDAFTAQQLMFPGSRPHIVHTTEHTRQAGVLLLLYPLAGEWYIALTRRTDTLRGVHSGQISFPGGRRDLSDDSFVTTALRETCEELGICEGIHVLGGLTPIYIPPSDFEVFPFVGVTEGEPAFEPSQAEVAEVFSVSLQDLLDARLKQVEQRDFQGQKVPIPYYAINGHKVWGATAIILSEFEHRLRVVLEDTQFS